MRHFPASFSSENLEREPEWQECLWTSYNHWALEKFKKKLVNVNALHFGVTVLTSYPQACRVWCRVAQYHRGAASWYWTPFFSLDSHASAGVASAVWVWRLLDQYRQFFASQISVLMFSNKINQQKYPNLTRIYLNKPDLTHPNLKLNQ